MSMETINASQSTNEESHSLKTTQDGGPEAMANETQAAPGKHAVYPMSFAQERMWLVDRLRPGSPVYNVMCTWEIRGPVSIAALAESLDDLLQRHGALRTRFSETSDGLRQQIVACKLSLKVVDLRQVVPPDRAVETETILQEAASLPFDLRNPPWLRAVLVRLADDESVLMLVMHHIASDGWSLGIVARELGQAYAARARGFAPTWPALPLQYPEYSVWQRQHLSGVGFARKIGYWRDRLQDLVPLDLPTDRRRPAVQGDQGATVEFTIPAELEAALNATARRHQVTLYMLMLAALQVLLARYSGQNDIAVGSPVSGRSRREHEELIGFFVNTVVMRGDLSGNPTFSDLLSRTRGFVLDALDYQEVPFEKLVEELRPARDLGRHPLVQVVFAMQNASSGDLVLDGLHCKRRSVRNATSKFDLFMSMLPGEVGLTGVIEYDVNLFDRVTVRHMAEQWVQLLRSVTADPDQPIERISMVPDEERLVLTEQWTDTTTSYPRDATVHGLFETMVKERPSADALLFEEGKLSYAELDTQAAALASRLRQSGAISGKVVGILLDRSPDLVVAMLAVLKSGGICMPLDAGHPLTRLRMQIQDSGAEVVVTSSLLKSLLDEEPVQLVCVDLLDETARFKGTDDAEPEITADSAAAIMYTSGSTGQPKGAVITHRNIVRLVRGTDYVPFGPERTFLQLAPPVFDASTFEIWGALLNGGRCAIMTERQPSLRSIAAALARYQVDTLWLTASLFNAFIDEQPELLSTVSWLVTGGEALSVSHVRRAIQLLPNVNFVNGYGPTETTTFACCYAIQKLLPLNILSIPIGRPIANTVCHVLDKHLQLVPIGVPGELYIGGDGVAAGYLDRAVLTGERFVPSPFGDGRMLYKSGDRVRWRPDGCLEFMGRFDEQLKLRGFRIEPGEIEAVLTELPVIRQALVMLREDHPGDRQLVAYLVGEGVEVESVKAHLARRLPEYMRPAAMVLLPVMPCTPNGKVDRRALPAPDGSLANRDPARAMPGTVLEREIHRIWVQILGIRDFGVHDNFFALGGHSLLAARVAHRINETLNIEVTLRLLFENPTVAGLAKSLSTRDSEQGDNVLVEPITKAVPLTDALVTIVRAGAGRAWVICVGGHVIESLLALPQDIGILYLGSGATDPLRFHRFGINGGVRRYVKEIQRLHLEGRFVTIGFSYGGLVAYALTAELRKLPGYLVDCVLLEPSTPESRTKPILAWLSRGVAFLGRLVRQGPSALAEAVRNRMGAKTVRVDNTSVSEADREWNLIGPQLISNIARYRPRRSASTGVHLLIGDHWIEHQLGRFLQRFTSLPSIHSLGDIDHHAVVDRADIIQRWCKLLETILHEGSVNAGKNGVTQIDEATSHARIAR
jgi:amino acid adenylation domain-containing protein